MIKLQQPSYDRKEILEVMDSLLSGNITMGEKNNKFEKDWEDKFGTMDSSTCNSGSSANLLMMSALKSNLLLNNIRDGDEIIVAGLGWSTSYFPIIQNRLKIRLVDIDLDMLSINVDRIEENITTETKAVLVIHIAGFSCDMDRVVKLCDKYDLYLLEDCCESLGAKWNNKLLGTFGDISTFSFFFSHHISCAEGGMICTQNYMIDNVIKMQRSHGWLRDVSNEQFKKEMIASNYAKIDPRYLFCDLGYNLRMNDLQASLGIHQLKKLDSFIEKRRYNHFYLCDRIRDEGLNEFVDVMMEKEKQFISPMTFPIICRDENIKKKLVDIFEKNNIETRPIASGNIVHHPFMNNYFDYFSMTDDLINCNHIQKAGLWIGNNQNINESDYDEVIKLMKEVLT